jgi:hypothetical protein
MRVPARPSRLKAISMPNARSDVWARRSRTARARGDFGHPSARHDMDSLAASAPIRRRSDAFPVQAIHRTRVATGSASITSSSAALRFASHARRNVPAGQKAVSQPFAAAAPDEPWGGAAIRSSPPPPEHRGCMAVQPENRAQPLARGAAGSRAGAAGEKNCSVRQVRSCDDVFDAVENDRSLSLKEHFLAIRIELADCEASLTREAAQRVGEPSRKVR